MGFTKVFLALLGFSYVAVVMGNEERIVGGVIAKKKHRKYLAYIFISNGQGASTCTGTILSSRYILSAAHCFGIVFFENNVVKNSFLYLGLKTANPTNQRSFDIEKVYMHKDYTGDIALPNDVAIIKLKEDIPEKKLHPVRLSKAPKNNKKVLAAGYGDLDESGTEPKFAMQVRVIHKNFKTCKKGEIASFRWSLKKKYHVCAVSLGFPDEGRTDTCYGDSGGPIFRKKGVQFGITSFAFSGCAEPGGIPWYVRVSTYKNVIEEVVNTGSSSAFDEYTS